MADATAGILNQTGSGTELIDASSLTVGANTVLRQRMVLADPTAGGNLAAVTAAGALKTDSSGVTQPVSAATLPLPAGAAADGTDATGVTQMTGGVGIRGWLSGIYSKLAGSIAVTGTFWQATQPVRGTVTANAGSGTLAVSAAALPLPTGAAADGTDATGVTQMTGGVGIRGWLSGIYSKLAGSIAVTGTFWQATQPVSGTVTANAGTGTLAVSAAALPLPTGAATSALQATLNVGAANFAVGQVALNGATPVQIVAARTGAPGTGRASITINNTAGVAIFLGPTNAVSASNGWELAIGEADTIETTSAVWAVLAAAGTPSGQYRELY